nr:hypothetical protein [Tanacetum cinerariifolium]
MWSDQEKRIQKIDRLARYLLIQGLPNDIYSLIDSNKTAKDLWDALARHMLGFEYGEQDRKAAVLYEYETFIATKGELLLNTHIRYLQVINDLKKCGYSKDNYVNDTIGSKKKTVVVTSDPLALIAEKTNVCRSKEKVVVSSDSKGSEADDFSELKKITVLLAKAFNQRKPITRKKDDEKKREMSRVKCYNCKKEGHFAKDCKKVKVKDYEYYKTKMLLAKQDKDEQALLAEDQAWMESSSDSDQEINANMVFMAQIEKVLYDSEASSSSADEKIFESQDVKTVSYLKLYDILKQHQNEVNKIKAERITRTANPLTLVAQQQPVYHPHNHPTHYTQYSSTKSQQATTRNRGKAIVNSSSPTYDQETIMVTEDNEMSKDKEIDKLMSLISLSFKKIYKPTSKNLRTSSNTSKANQDKSLRINKGTGYDN